MDLQKKQWVTFNTTHFSCKCKSQRPLTNSMPTLGSSSTAIIQHMTIADITRGGYYTTAVSISTNNLMTTNTSGLRVKTKAMPRHTEVVGCVQGNSYKGIYKLDPCPLPSRLSIGWHSRSILFNFYLTTDCASSALVNSVTHKSIVSTGK